MFYSKSTGGFYDIEIHGKNIPADAVEIDAAKYAELLDAQSNGKLIVADLNGFPIATDAPAKSFTDLKATKIKEINDTAQALIDSLTADYPAFEIETWADQKAEVKAWKADPDNAATPVIDILAARRKIDRVAYLTKTLLKVEAFEQVVYATVGDRQAYVDAVNAIANTDNATNRKKVDAITPIYPAP